MTLIARDRARSSLEMQVQQDGQMLLGPEADRRAAAANELRGPENLQLKLSDHCIPSHAPKRFRNSALRL